MQFEKLIDGISSIFYFRTFFFKNFISSISFESIKSSVSLELSTPFLNTLSFHETFQIEFKFTTI